MDVILRFLSIIVSAYMLIIVVRILLTWFRGSVRIPDFLTAITDPYLAWFRQLGFLRIGHLDLSPVAALAVLSILNQVLGTLARYGTVSLGIILAMLLGVVWSVLSFFLVLVIIALGLRLIAYLTNQNTRGVFWGTVDTISRPVLFRISRILFKDRIVKFRTSLLISIGLSAAAYGLLALAVNVVSGLLVRLPV